MIVRQVAVEIPLGRPLLDDGEVRELRHLAEGEAAQIAGVRKVLDLVGFATKVAEGGGVVLQMVFDVEASPLVAI
jgi:hypothetical protein